MKYAVVVLLLFLAGCRQTILPSSEMPEYLVMLTSATPHTKGRCSGVALNSYYILTANHCTNLFRVVTQYNQATDFVVVMTIPEMDVALLKTRKELLLNSFAHLDRIDKSLPAFIYGVCPFYFQHVGRRVDYLGEKEIRVPEEKVKHPMHQWITISEDEMVCGGDSGGVVVQNGNVIGITSAIDSIWYPILAIGKVVYTVPATDFADKVSEYVQ